MTEEQELRRGVLQRLDHAAKESRQVAIRDRLRETWIVCPRQHALNHNFRVLPDAFARIMCLSLQEINAFYMVWHAGHDLVFAIAPSH